jgi:hypothetical protein
VSWVVVLSAPTTGGVEELVVRLREPELSAERVENRGGPSRSGLD